MKRKEPKLPAGLLAKLIAKQDYIDKLHEERRVSAQVRSYVEWRLRAGRKVPVAVYPGTLGALKHATSKGATARALSRHYLLASSYEWEPAVTVEVVA